jgi:hypothetical protein
MPATKLRIPAGLDFSALKLRRHLESGDMEFEWAPIEAICTASGIDPVAFRQTAEANLASLISAWYRMHRELGGAADPVAEQITAEKKAAALASIASFQEAPARLQ